VSPPLDVLLEYLDRAIADAERRASVRGKANDWSEFAYQRRRAADFQKQRDRLFRLLSTATEILEPQKVLDTLVNSV
jgi:hypothetical protein